MGEHAASRRDRMKALGVKRKKKPRKNKRGDRQKKNWNARSPQSKVAWAIQKIIENPSQCYGPLKTLIENVKISEILRESLLDSLSENYETAHDRDARVDSPTSSHRGPIAEDPPVADRPSKACPEEPLSGTNKSLTR